MSNITIYHNPACGTSRNTLEMIRNSGNEPNIIYYLDTPPTRDELVQLIKDMGIPVRALLRQNVEPYAQLGLAEEIFYASASHPDQSTRGGHAAGDKALPAFRSGAGDPARRSEGRFHERGWRKSD